MSLIMIRFYGHLTCSTCRDARAHLTKLGVKFDDINIVETPPPKAMLKAILASGTCTLPQLFNRSGELYRDMKMKDKLPKLSEAEALELLAKHGMLVKRPIVTDGKKHTVGFKAEQYDDVWG